MAGYTPGPWDIWTTMDNTLTIRAANADIADICPIGTRKPVPFPGQTEHDAPGGTPSDEEKANARLIAAAPDLYQACKTAIPYAPSVAVVLALRAAVAKAEGTECWHE